MSIIAIVQYSLPTHIGRDECRNHYHAISRQFKNVNGLISKHFIYQLDGQVAGGVYQWESEAAAREFYEGPWLQGIIERYGQAPTISFHELMAVTDNTTGDIQNIQAA